MSPLNNITKVVLALAVSLQACSETAFEPFPENLDWQDIAQLPQGRSDFGVAVFRDRIHIVGGWTDDFQATRTVYRYDPDLDSWDHLQDFPIEIADLALVVSNDTLFAVGGVRATTAHPSRMLRAYDPVTDSWINRPPILDERAGHATLELNGTIFLLGGPMNEASSHGPRVPGDSVLAYDVATATWTYRDPMPKPRFGVVGVRHEDRLHTIGGVLLSTGVPDDELDTYDPATDTWDSLTYDPYTSSSPAAALLDGQIHLIGGSVAAPGASGSATHRTFSLADQTWVYRGEMWVPLTNARSLVYRGELYVFGGSYGRRVLNRVLVYRPQQ